MNPKKYKLLLDNISSDKRFYRLMFMISVVACLGMAIAVNRLIGVERTIIVPPEISKSFWIDNNKVSKSYLEEMALYIAQLELTITPDSFRFQSDQLLRYVYPSAVGEMRSSLDARETQLRRDQIASWFAPADVFADEKNLQVKLKGRLTSYVGKEQLPPAEKTYLVEFFYNNSRLYLKTFNEVVDEKAKKVSLNTNNQLN